MKIILTVVLLFSYLQAYSDVAKMGLYDVIVKSDKGELLEGKILILDYGTALKSSILKGESLVGIKRQKTISIFKKIDRVKNPYSLVLTPEYTDQWSIENKEILIAKKDETQSILTESIISVEIINKDSTLDNLNIFGDNEVMMLDPNNYYLFTERDLLSFLVFETAVNRRIFIYCYENMSRGELYRYIFFEREDIDPFKIRGNMVISRGVFAITQEFDAESI